MDVDAGGNGRGKWAEDEGAQGTMLLEGYGPHTHDR